MISPTEQIGPSPGAPRKPVAEREAEAKGAGRPEAGP